MGRKWVLNLRDTDGLKKLLNKHRGLHSLDDERPHYTTLSELMEFWTDRRIRQAFKDCAARYHDSAFGVPFFAPERTRAFLRLFSLLVSIDRLETIEHCFLDCDLTDEKFPIREFPSDWDDTSQRRELFQLIQEEQWKFFPFIFEPSRLFNPELALRYILPINEVENVHKTEETIVDLIYVDPLCANKLGEKQSEPVRLVRKQYLGQEHEAAFLREKRAYEALHNYKYRSPHFVDCYGYFSQTLTDGTKVYNLLLEYIDGGSLTQFYLDCKPPRNQTELVHCWKSFAGALEGLHAVHQVSKQANTDEEEHQIVHQDIKPSNLLVSTKPGRIPLEFIIKLADFGYSCTHLRASYANNNGGLQDSGGGQTYGAPENSRHERCTQNDLHLVTPMVDVWSFGCVLSETCAWLAFGPTGRQDYESRRTEEIDLHEALKRAGHSGCFHDGYKMLQKVKETHKQVEASLPSYDKITPQVIRMIEDDMLLSDASQRLTPYQLFAKMRSFIDHAEAQAKGPCPSTATTSSRALKPETKRLVIRRTPEFPTQKMTWKAKATASKQPTDQTTQDTESSRTLWLTYKEARAYVEDRAGRPRADPRVKDAITSLKAALEGRDVIFYIENSPSMEKHRHQIRETLGTYAYITKLIDDNGIEVVYASSPRNVRKHANTRPLLQAFDKQSWRHSMFEDKLSNFIDDRISKRLPAWWKIGPLRPKRLSIYYFTDGNWGHGDSKACGVERPIEKLIDTMIEKSISRTQISIQLVQFGDSKEGQRYLRMLDSLGKRKKDMDIVDTKPYDWDVYATLIGSLHQNIDDEGEASASADSDVS